MDEVSDEDRHKATKVYHNQPYDESLEVHDSEDVASLSTSSPVPATAVAARPANVAPTTHKAAEDHRRSRGDTPPESRMSNQSDDEFETGGGGVGGPGQLGSLGGPGGPSGLPGPLGLDGGQIPPGKEYLDLIQRMAIEFVGFILST
ncbi:hypothetical protein LSAT2_002742 [Lamellibrachia satsuma]|nr:hypothetical protein LSAT2_002742 [Lamellibrachia satsuma]